VPHWVLVTHVFNHQTHHRGQLRTILTQQGVDVGSTDLPFMPSLMMGRRLTDKSSWLKNFFTSLE
jgi:uncharacterized damage-inducible protein DinB